MQNIDIKYMTQMLLMRKPGTDNSVTAIPKHIKHLLSLHNFFLLNTLELVKVVGPGHVPPLPHCNPALLRQMDILTDRTAIAYTLDSDVQ